jgi:hypothetical protein
MKLANLPHVWKTKLPTISEALLCRATVNEQAQVELERTFFSLIRTKNGTFKKTYDQRLDDVNCMLNELLPRDRELSIMDVAVSSGITTLDWMDSLERAGVQHRMTASDLSINGFLVSFGRRCLALVDKSGNPLFYEVYGHGIPNTLRRNLMYLPFVLGIRLVLSIGFCRTVREAIRGERCSKWGISVRRTMLVSPRVSRRPNLELVEDDLLHDSPCARFHVVRAANILNLSYFPESKLKRMIINLRARLLTSGFLVICRTDEDGANHATVFRLGESGTFGVLARINGGSEVEQLVLQVEPHTSGTAKIRTGV